MTIHGLLLKRFATKKFDPMNQISDEDLAYILEAARLSCSSANTQPWFITVVTNQELRSKLRDASFGQSQVTDASHLLVLSSMKDPMVRIKKTASLIEGTAGSQAAEGYKKMVTGWIPATPEGVFGWLKPQVYLALQAMILAAAEKGIDSCPMEGFNPQVYAELLDLTDKTPCVLLPIGYAAESGFPKVRVPLTDMVEYKK